MAVGYRDYYDVLGVGRDADADEIRRAYRKLARENHPDINKDPTAEDRFKEVAEAYEVLRDPEKRAQYDRLGANWRAGQDVSGADGFGAGGYRDVGGDFGQGGDFSDFFESLFGGRYRAAGGRRGPTGFADMPMRGADHEAMLQLTLVEAAAGGHRHFTLDNGRGYDVDVPVGVRDGQRIRLAGEGGAGRDGGPSGDLFLRVHILPDPRFVRDGQDLHVDVDISPSEAVLGARVPVPTLTGSVRVRVPAGSSSGRKLRLRGEGMPSLRGEHGDLFAHVRIVVPKGVGDHERELYEQLAAASTFDPREVRR